MNVGDLINQIRRVTYLEREIQRNLEIIDSQPTDSIQGFQMAKLRLDIQVMKNEINTIKSVVIKGD